ncbi:KTSC domain-containing protein [Mesorhizobium sp. AR10]|uniref:KTSC domain-containing protein n=1 Tax=Mesorhizobium sp. AR10 TaxID=2865839 RepID=UPI0021601802|nr:KTSC domain-containing protein [Mesorhizobium sp. AR10]UVK39378.1 KTSC domain-containing protein [Mesorhizobium sp. AR10]
MRDEAERAALLALPLHVRLRTNMLAVLVVCSLAAIALVMALGSVFAETVDVKYRGPVDLAKFQCTAELDSSVVKRVCYNAEHAYMLIRLKQVWYHYCQIDQDTVSALLADGSKGAFYNENIKDAATRGKFGCRDKPIPQF